MVRDFANIYKKELPVRKLNLDASCKKKADGLWQLSHNAAHLKSRCVRLVMKFRGTMGHRVTAFHFPRGFENHPQLLFPNTVNNSYFITYKSPKPYYRQDLHLYFSNTRHTFSTTAPLPLLQRLSTSPPGQAAGG